MTTYNLSELIEATSELLPDRAALVCGERTRTFAELDTRATRLPAYFQQARVVTLEYTGRNQNDEVVAVATRQVMMLRAPSTASETGLADA